MYRQQDQQGYYPRRSYMQQAPTQHGNLTYTEEIPEEFGLPIEDIVRTSSALYERSEQNRMASEELQMAAEQDLHKVRDVDRDNILGVISNIDKELSSFVEGGNFHMAGQKLSSLYRGYINDPGRVSSIQAREKEVAHAKAIEEREDLLQTDKEAALRVSQAWSSPVKVNDDGTTSGGYKEFVPAERVDGVELAHKYLKDRKPNQIHEETWDFENLGESPYIGGTIRKDSSVTYEEHARGVTNILMADDGYKAWLESKYIMENVDPETGELVQPNEEVLTDYFVSTLPQYDNNGNQKYDNEKDAREDARDALTGAISRVQKEAKRINGKELSREEALQRVHKQSYIQSNVNDVISALAEPLVHANKTLIQKTQKDLVYEGRKENAAKLISDVYGLNSLPDNMSPREIATAVQDNNRQLRDIDTRIENTRKRLINNGDLSERVEIEDEIESLEYQKNALEAKTDFQRSLFEEYRSHISEEDYDKLIKRLKFQGLASIIPEETIEKAIKSGNLDELLDPIREAKSKTIFAPNEDDVWVKGASKFIGRHLINPMFTIGTGNTPLSWKLGRLEKEIESGYDDLLEDVDVEAYHRDYYAVNVEGGVMERNKDIIKEAIENGTMQWKTVNGISSTNEDYRKEIEGASDISLTYVGDIHNNEMAMLLTHLDEDGNQIRSDIIESPMPGGFTEGHWREIFIGANSDHYQSHPRTRQALTEMAVAGLAGLEEVYTPEGASMGMGLKEALNELNVDAYGNNKTTSDNPIHIKRDGMDISLVFKKTKNGVQAIVQYPDGGSKKIGERPTSAGTLVDIFRELENIKMHHLNYMQF